MAKTSTKAARDNRANQLNPNHSAYRSSRGGNTPTNAEPAEAHPAQSVESPQNPAAGKDGSK